MDGVSTPLDTVEPAVIRPDVAHLVTEDDTPVDNIVSEKQMRLLTTALYASWRPGRKFLAMANVGLFSSVAEPPVVPDMLLSMDVEAHPDGWAKEHRSYFMWEYGKPPEVVVEIVSNREGGETSRKMERYARMRIEYYVIYDPENFVQPKSLMIYVLLGGIYEPMRSNLLPLVNLRAVEWEGVYEGYSYKWLRWADRSGELILTGEEDAERQAKLAEKERRRAAKEKLRADREQQRADQEQQRADQEKARADALAEKLRQLGIDPTKP